MIDLALAIDALVPAAQYGGSTTANTREAFEALHWTDARPKPTWAEVSATGIDFDPTPGPSRDLAAELDAFIVATDAKFAAGGS